MISHLLNAGLVPSDQLHAICMWDGADPENHTETYLRVKNELQTVWVPYVTKYFPSYVASERYHAFDPDK